MSILKLKLPALTLIDALVGMIISALAVAFAVSAYQVIYKQFYEYKRMNKVIVDVTQFNAVFRNDFFKGRFIKKDHDGLEIDLPVRYGEAVSNALYENQITYQFMEKYIVRKVNHNPDTFFIACINPVALFLKQTQDQNAGLVDELSFQVRVFNDVEMLHFKKQYGADILMLASDHTDAMGWGGNFDNK